MSKYEDVAAIVQVIGGIYENPQLLDEEDKYFFIEEDYPNPFHKIMFEAMFNSYALGAKELSVSVIENYFEQRPAKLAIYKLNNGEKWLNDLKGKTKFATFDYYYNRVKKMTLLREYFHLGIDLNWLYDVDNIFDPVKKQKQEDWLDNTNLDEIATLVMDKVLNINDKCINNSDGGAEQAGEGILELIQSFKDNPDFGSPLFGDALNSIIRGARITKFYLRSAPSGFGKSRGYIADACYLACDEIYDLNERKWIKNGIQEPTLYITTELKKEEVQSMMLAFLSGVDEEHIKINTYDSEDEQQRVLYAATLIAKAPLYIKHLPDFSMRDIMSTIKTNVRKLNIRYVFHDYIHTSLKIFEEISKRTKGIAGLREDNILLMISILMKDLCNELDIFIMSGTQLNADWHTSKTPDMNLLRGAKSIADKVDVGMHILPVTEEDLKNLENVIAKGFPIPNMKYSIYKNRGGKFSSVYLWAKADLGICRTVPLFLTNWTYTLQEVENIQIKVIPESAF